VHKVIAKSQSKSGNEINSSNAESKTLVKQLLPDGCKNFVLLFENSEHNSKTSL